jgi:hypothetical protein
MAAIRYDRVQPQAMHEGSCTSAAELLDVLVLLYAVGRKHHVYTMLQHCSSSFK